MKIKILILLLVLTTGLQQGLCYDQIFGSPSYSYSQVLSRWGNVATISNSQKGELHQAAYAAVSGGAHIRGWLHRSFVWNGDSGAGKARFDFALCAEIATGTSHSSVEIRVRGFLRDVSTGGYPIRTSLYKYYRSTPGYRLFLHGDVIDRDVDLVKGHKYTIGYTVDVSANCYPRSYCPMAGANMGEKGCSFWWQPTGVFEG